jgi:death on curing protein
MKYLSAEQVLFIHSRLIDETGGSHGIRDTGLLQAAVERPKATFGGKDLYPDSFYKAAALLESLIKNHPFIDGNKRTAMASTGLFLQKNGYSLETSQKDFVRFALAMATKNIKTEDAAKWIKENSRKLKKQ